MLVVRRRRVGVMAVRRIGGAGSDNCGLIWFRRGVHTNFHPFLVSQNACSELWFDMDFLRDLRNVFLLLDV